MSRGDDDLERLREEMACGHETRQNLLTALAKGGGKKELRAWQFRSLLPRRGRPSLANVKYHLRVLCAAQLVGTDDDPEDPYYRLNKLI